MIILRKAELKDFDTYKILYEDNEETYQWLYIDETIKEKHLTENEKKAIMEKMKQEFGNFSEYQQEFKNYTLEKFQKSLLKDYNFIYMIENDCKVVGYVKIVHQFGGEYRIEEWAMLNPKDDEIKEEVLGEILKLRLPKLRIFLISTLSKSVGQWLLSKGFKCSCITFYKLEIKKQKER